MNIEEQIRITKPYHKSLAIDMVSFKDRVLSVEYPSAGRQTNQARLFWKKPLPIAVVAVVSVGLLGFTAAKLQWFGTTVNMDSPSGGISSLQTPLESWTNTIQEWHIQNPMTLSEARSVSSYPIREPAQIPNWTLLQDFGWGTPVIKTDANGTVSHSTGPVQFLDLWTNASGQKIAVQQRLSNVVLGSATVGFPAGSYQINSFKPDLAVMMNLQNGRSELAIFHIEGDKKVTELDFYGTTSPSTLESFAEEYLNSSTN